MITFSMSLFYYAVITTLISSIAITTDGFSTPSFPIGGEQRRSLPRSSSNHQQVSVSLAAASEKGFGATAKESESSSPQSTTSPNDSNNNDNNNNNNNNSGEIYSKPSLYDMAFGYRNFEEEVDFLMDQHRQLNQDNELPKRVLELAAGPARHCIEALSASYIESATAIDNSADMVEYAREIAAEELKSDDYTAEEISGTDIDKDASYENRVNSLNYIQADMTNFTIPSKEGGGDGDGGDDDDDVQEEQLFDSAWILLGSLQHLTTNEQVISCFKCIHRVLQPNGTFILELPHPRETFSLVECTRNGWDVPLEDDNGKTSGELKIVWGDDNDDFDPITQVRQFTVSMELKGENTSESSASASASAPGKSKTKSKRKTDSGLSTLQSVKEVVPMRHFTSQEIDLFARIAGFEVMSMHGALAFDVDVNDDDQAFRLVCVLQKQ